MEVVFSKRTAQDIYLEYVNDWLTVAAMADNYGRTVQEMSAIIEKGKTESLLKNWYLETYPDDELGKEIRPNATFADLYEAINKGHDVYAVTDVSDSLIRERLFKKLAELKGVDYSEIYNKWLAA